jgi:hypothetical protein
MCASASTSRADGLDFDVLTEMDLRGARP